MQDRQDAEDRNDHHYNLQHRILADPHKHGNLKHCAEYPCEKTKETYQKDEI
jgi:hypothetical protein